MGTGNGFQFELAESNCFLFFFFICFLHLAHTATAPPPANVTANVTSSTSANAQWLPVSRNDSSKYAYNYTVKWTSVKNVTANITVVTTFKGIQGLEPFTTYEKRLATVDGNQTGAFSGPVQVQTLEGGKFDLLNYLT